MTEEEWLALENPLHMLRLLGAPMSKRKLRLFCCALCRTVWDNISNEQCRTAIDIAERFADDRSTRAELHASWVAVDRAQISHLRAPRPGWQRAVLAAVAPESSPETVLAKRWLRGWSNEADGSPSQNRLWERDRLILLDLTGPQFRAVTFDPAWRTDTAVLLARQMYESRDFGAMPILADALQDAGCDSDDVLNHCRGPGPHVRGCWVVDMALGKE